MPEQVQGETGQEFERLAAGGEWETLAARLEDRPAPEVADLLRALEEPARIALLRALHQRGAADAFAHLEPEQQIELLAGLGEEDRRGLLESLAPDDRTRLLEDLSEQDRQRLMALLSPEDLQEAHWLLGYPEDSAGRLMTPDLVAVRPHWKISQALRQVRRKGKDSETVNRIYVIDDHGRLVDDFPLRRLILADPEARVADLMDHTFASVPALADREEAVSLIRRYDQVALPVVDARGLLLGIVTVDDLLDVAEEEATEDFHRVASVGPIRVSLRDAPIHLLYRARIGWLMTLVFVNVLSGAGIAFFEETIHATVALVFFLPLIIGSGGNAGSQSATLMVRALATGDVQRSDWLALLFRELRVALLIGVTMSLGVALVAWYRAPEVLLIVSSTMTLIVLVGSLIGLSLPFLLSRLGFDPATASAPLITSLADIAGVLIYFSIATWYLGLG